MNKLLILAFTIAFSSLTSAEEVVSSAALVDAGAAPAASVEKSFKSLDANQDNVISRTEAEGQTELLNAFIDIDIDRTGDISEVEYNKFATLAK